MKQDELRETIFGWNDTNSSIDLCVEEEFPHSTVIHRAERKPILDQTGHTETIQLQDQTIFVCRLAGGVRHDGDEKVE